MFRKVNHNRAHNYWFTLCHIIFTAISGWCWKHCNSLELRLQKAIDSTGIPAVTDPLVEPPPQFLIANGLFIYLTLHGALGILRFGHPQLSLNAAFRKVYEISFVSLRVLPTVLITAQIYNFYICQLDWIGGYAASSFLFDYDLTLFILGCAAVAILNDLWKGYSWIKATILIVNVVLLVLVGSLDEYCYWTLVLAVQILWNNFGLDVISGRYEVCIGVYCEVFTIGLSFFNIFAFNSLSELIDLILVSYDR